MEYTDSFEAISKYSHTCFDDWSNKYCCTDIYYYGRKELMNKALEAIKAYCAEQNNDTEIRVIENPINSEYPWAIAVEMYMEA